MTNGKELLLGEPERVFRREESPVLRLNEEEANAAIDETGALDDDHRMILNMGPSHPSDRKSVV